MNGIEKITGQIDADIQKEIDDLTAQAQAQAAEIGAGYDRQAQEQTQAAFTRIVKKGRLSFSGCDPVSDSLKRLEIGGTLGAGELLRICKVLKAAGRAKSYGRHETVDEAADCLDVYFDQIEPLTNLAGEIDRCIISEEEISDEASPGLKHIRRQISLAGDKIHSTLTSLVNGPLRS